MAWGGAAGDGAPGLPSVVFRRSPGRGGVGRACDGDGVSWCAGTRGVEGTGLVRGAIALGGGFCGLCDGARSAGTGGVAGTGSGGGVLATGADGGGITGSGIGAGSTTGSGGGMGSGTGCTAISSVAIGRGGTMGLIIAL